MAFLCHKKTKAHGVRFVINILAVCIMKTKFYNITFNILGTICVTLGILGIFLPLLPTTPFALAAAILFSRVNPKFHSWLLKNRFLGPYIDNYYNKMGVTLAYKVRTFIFLWVGLISSMIIIVNTLWLYILLTIIGVSVSTHIFLIKTR